MGLVIGDEFGRDATSISTRRAGALHRGTHAGALESWSCYRAGARGRATRVARVPCFVASAPIVYDGPLSRATLAASTAADATAKTTSRGSRPTLPVTGETVDKELNGPSRRQPSNVPLLYSMLRHAYLLELGWHPHRLWHHANQ